MNLYQAPTTVRLTVNFSNVDDGTPVDPTTVTLLLTRPEGLGETDYTAEVVRAGIGAYHLDINVDTAGHWRYRWRGAGAVVVTSAVARFRAV